MIANDKKQSLSITNGSEMNSDIALELLVRMDIETLRKVSLIPERPGEMRDTLADIAKARELLGWQPEVTLEEAYSGNRQSDIY